MVANSLHVKFLILIRNIRNFYFDTQNAFLDFHNVFMFRSTFKKIYKQEVETNRETKIDGFGYRDCTVTLD
jgi:hypothetical protein